MASPGQPVDDDVGAAVFRNSGPVSNQVGNQKIYGAVTYNITQPYRAVQLNGEGDKILERRTRFHDSLRFDQLEARYQTIEQAHFATCQWILTCPEYTTWLQDDMLSEHQGLMWIKGKPGVGKSTIMKFIYTHMMQQHGGTIILAFFFNARGQELEKSTNGMYRSFIFNILRKFPELLIIMDEVCPGKNDMMTNDWDVATLVDLFVRIVRLLGARRITCFVDALDECDEDQVRHMISVFEYLCQTAAISKTPLRFCLSSRHYPQITIPFGETLILEEQKEHKSDIAKYLKTTLRIGDSENAREIELELMRRASGIFLWIRLVTRILNKEYDRGYVLTLRKRLEEIPDDLGSLLDDILTRDGLPGADFALCVQWILYARTPLKAEELYFALLVGNGREWVVPWDPHDISIEDIQRYFLDCCRGLTEQTKGEKPTIQFIHESVRDYFLTRHDLQRLSFGDTSSFTALNSHNVLRDCCQSYSSNFFASQRDNLEDSRLDDITSRYPFLRYAVAEVFYHSEMALTHDSAQDTFLRDFPLQIWLKLTNFLRSKYPWEVDLLWVLATKDVTLLTKQVYTRDRSMGTGRLCSEHISPLKAAAENANAATIELFLTPSDDDPAQITKKRTVELPNHKVISAAVDYLCKTRGTGRTLLTEAAYSDEYSAVRCLLAGGWYNGPSDLALSLYAAAQEGRESLVRLLLDAGADVNGQGRWGDSALCVASCRGHNTIVQILIDAGADVNKKAAGLGSVLCGASANRQDETVRILLKAGADVNMRVEYHGCAICAAALGGSESVVRALIEAGADVNMQGGERGNALYIAASSGVPGTVKALLEAGAEVDANNEGRGTAYEAALLADDEEIMNMLAGYGRTSTLQST